MKYPSKAGYRSLAAVGVAAVLGLTACSSSGGNNANTGGGGNNGGGGATTSATSTGSPTSNGGGGSSSDFSGQSFTILGQWTGGEGKAFQDVISKFDKATGASGKYTAAAGGDEATVLGSKVAGGSPPDVAIVSLPGDIQKYAKGGNIKPLVASTKKAVTDNFASEWATLGSYNGKAYGVPVDASDKSTIWYNADLFKNAGISSPPATWPDLIKDANTLKQSGVSVPISVGGGDGWTLTDWFENVYLRTAGVDMYDKLTQHQIKWTDPSVTKALNILKQIWGNENLIGSPQKAVQTPFTASVDNVFKSSPTSAIVYEASFVATTITSDKDPAKVGTTALVAPFPSVNGSKPVLEAAGDFAVAFSNKPVVQGFLAYLAGSDAAQTLVSAPGSGFISANKQMPNSAYLDSTTAQLGKQVVSVGNNFRFDMSDQAPSTFGGTANKGEWGDLQTFLKTGDVKGTQQQLEKDAAAAYK